jgi:hypothetical protein
VKLPFIAVYDLQPVQTTPITLLLVFSSIYNTYSMFTRTRTYKFHRKADPLASPHAQFVATNLDLEPLPQPTLKQRVLSNAWYGFSYFWRFLLGMAPPTRSGQPQGKISKVQELRAWDPTDIELELFSIYSPAHAFLWLGMGYTNWLVSILVMGLIGVQVRGMLLLILAPI